MFGYQCEWTKDMHCRASRAVSKTMAKLRDLVCLGLWVFSYRAIVLIFLLLRKFEGKRQGTRQLPGAIGPDLGTTDWKTSFS